MRQDVRPFAATAQELEEKGYLALFGCAVQTNEIFSEKVFVANTVPKSQSVPCCRMSPEKLDKLKNAASPH